jgi:hypothetical protein
MTRDIEKVAKTILCVRDCIHVQKFNHVKTLENVKCKM